MMDTKTNIPNNTEMTPVISLKGVSKWYGDFQALSNIDLEIKLKEKIVICGPSGSGKSTLLNIVGLLDTHDEGNYFLNGNGRKILLFVASSIFYMWFIPVYVLILYLTNT